jgi:hypothetical protein
MDELSTCVMPAKAGIQSLRMLDSRLRGSDADGQFRKKQLCREAAA